MSVPWQSVLDQYRAKHFHVLTHEQLVQTSPEKLTKDLPLTPAVISFLRSLSQPQMTLGKAFVTSVQAVHTEVQTYEIFAPLRNLLSYVTNVAVLYGEHFAWKSPDQWSYLFEVKDVNDQQVRNYVLAHPPATKEAIQQAETMLGMQLPSQYVQFLQATNGLGLALNETQFICGAGEARASWGGWDKERRFQPATIPQKTYHEIASYWFQWQDVLAYERQRDRETGLTTFQSDERVCVPFASTIDDWCFDRSQPDEEGEYRILFWDHELRQATYMYTNFAAWFVDIVIHRRL